MADIANIALVVSAIATSIAAICALVTTRQNRTVNKDMKIERHAMVKPIFQIKYIFEKSIDKTIDLGIKNIGFDKFNSLNAYWQGADGVEVIIFEDSTNEDRDYVIKLNFGKARFTEEKTNGKLILFFIDILGKEYKESIEIDIHNNHNSTLNIDLTKVQNKLFNKRFE